MKPICLTVFLVGGLLATSMASAQCRGGAAVTTGTTTGTTAGMTTANGVLTPMGFGGGTQLLTGPGSLAYDVMMAQMISRQIGQQQTMLAMQQQKIKEQKLADRRYRAEQTRASVAESRARTRAALAAAGGLPIRKSPDAALVSYQMANARR